MAQASNRSGPGGCCEGLGKLLPARLFKALGDPTRVGLLVAIAESAEPATVGELAKGRPVDMSVVSRHLGVLREAGIIECVKQGKEVRCSLRKADVVRSLRELADALESCCGGLPKEKPGRRE